MRSYSFTVSPQADATAILNSIELNAGVKFHATSKTDTGIIYGYVNTMADPVNNVTYVTVYLYDSGDVSGPGFAATGFNYGVSAAVIQASHLPTIAVASSKKI